MQNAIKLENISNLITSPSSYQCRKRRLVHFFIHGRHASMECMCAYWGTTKVNFQNKWQKILSYRIIRIKRIFSGVYWCITWTNSLASLQKSPSDFYLFVSELVQVTSINPGKNAFNPIIKKSLIQMWLLK